MAEKHDAVKPLFKWFQDIYVMVCKAREISKQHYVRERLKERCEQELKKWLDVAKPYKELKTI